MNPRISASPLLARARFLLERFLLRGAQYRLLFIAAVIGLLSVLAGVLVLPSDAFDSFPEAVWWAFLRLSDPGYLGDDEGAFVRVVSTVLTVTGYVVFLGSLVAIMTQWLNSTMARLESGMTPVRRQHHVVILGFTNRTVSMIRELLLSEERVHRFLRLRGARALHIVVLVEDVTPALRQQFRDELGELWEEQRITLRSGSLLREDHLDRVDILRAGVVLLPGSDVVGPEGGGIGLDTRTVKTLLTLDHAVQQRGATPGPLVVAEIHDPRKVPLARRAYRGPAEFVASDAVVARLLAQNLRHPGLSHIHGELLSQDEGNEIYLPEGRGLEGARVEELAGAFPKGLVLGVLRGEGSRAVPLLNPPPGSRVEPGDRIVVMARQWGDVQTPLRPPPTPNHPGRAEARRRQRTLPSDAGARRRVLILGWSPKVPAILRELASYRDTAWDVTVFSRVDPARRRHVLARHGLDGLDGQHGNDAPASGGGEPTLQPGVRVRHLAGDFTVQDDLARAHPLEQDRIVLLGGDSHRTGGEADARTILGSLLLREMATPSPGSPCILVELLDPENRRLLEEGDAEVLVTPILVSHVLAQVALRRDLQVVFEELFTAGGPEISFHPARDLGLAGPVTFADVQGAAADHGQTALGLRPRGAPPLLNPNRTGRWEAEAVEVVLLGTPSG